MGWGAIVRREKTRELLSEFEPSEELLICVEQAAYYKLGHICAVAMVHGDVKEVLPVVKDENDNERTVVAVCKDGETETSSCLKIPESIVYIVLSGQFACHGIRFDVDKNNQFYQSRNGALYSKSGCKLLSYVSEEFDKGMLKDVEDIDYLKISSEESDIITIPDTVKRIESLHIKCQDLRFEGNLPELGDFSGVKAKKIYVNQTLDEIPEDRFVALSNVRCCDDNLSRAEIITKSPEFSADIPTDQGPVLLSDEIIKQLSNFSESKYLSKELLIYQHRGVEYYKIPNTKNAVIACAGSYARDVLTWVEDEAKVKWTVAAICSKENYSSDDFLAVPRTIEHIVLSGWSYVCHGRRFKVDTDNPFYQSDDNGALFTKDGSVLLSLTAHNADCIVIPSSVERVDRLSGNCKSLRFEGHLPRLGDVGQFYTEKIYVNQMLKEVPRDRYEMIYNVKIANKEWRTAEIITKKPVLSTEVPTTPGFIGLTRVDNDEYEYINPRYIIKMSPLSFEKYDGEETGTRVHYAAHGSERAVVVDYYEKLLDADSKIKDAQEALAQSIGGLAGILEKVNDLYKLSQTERS